MKLKEKMLTIEDNKVKHNREIVEKLVDLEDENKIDAFAYILGYLEDNETKDVKDAMQKAYDYAMRIKEKTKNRRKTL